VRLLLLVIPLLASLAACWRTDPLYCERNSDCADVSGRPFCDVDGTYPGSDGISHTCIADPGGACTSDDECTDPALPACSNNACRECSATHACGADAPVCDVAESTCAGCTAETDCATFADRPHCSPTDGACVGCTADADCAAGQACLEATRTCGACTADADCESGVCDEDTGACVATVNILHVDEKSASSSPDCSASSPCKTLLEAHARVAGDRKYILVHPGSYDGATLEGKTVTVVGDRAVVDGSLRLSGPEVALYGVELRRGRLELAGDAATVDRVRVTQNLEANYNAIVVDATSTTIRNSTIENNPTVGIIVNGGRSTVTRIENCLIRDNAFYGVYAATVGTVVVVERSRILNNAVGGIAVGGAGFNIINNFIAGNGTTTGASSGIEVSSNSPAGQIEHNTIIGNVGNGGSLAAGIRCGNGTSLAFRNNIIYGNQPSGQPQVSGSCQHTYSVIGPSAPPVGQGNINADPLVVDAGDADFHLLPSSPARDAADPVRDRSAPGVTVNVDVDGERRPAGARADIGADEIP
jgi:Cys-rich repeat protein